MLADIWGDVRFGMRQLRRAPGYALVVGLTIALSVGSVAALTSVLHATLWSQLPFSHADRLMVVRDVNTRDTSEGPTLVTMARFADLQTLQQNGRPVLQRVANLFLEPSAIAPAGQEPRSVQKAGVSDDFFAALDAPVLLGRTLTSADNVRGSPLHVVVSYGLWQSEFAANPRVIGSVVHVGGDQATIVGVMGRSFAYPVGVDVWAPGLVQPSTFGSYRGEGSRYLTVIARMAPGQTAKSVQAGLEALASRLAKQYPLTDGSWEFATVSIRDGLFGSYRNTLTLTGASLAVLLLVVLLNLSSLQVTRGVARETEWNIRAALGVSETRLLQQLLTENAMLTTLAGLAGLALAKVFLMVGLSQVPRGLLAVNTPALDWLAVSAMVLFCAGVSLLASVVSWQVARRLREGGSLVSSASRVSPQRTVAVGRTLSILQVASAFALLAFSASVLNELYRLMHAPLGYTVAHVQTFTVDKGWGWDHQKSHLFYEGVENRLRALPGVEAVGAMSALPLTQFQVRTPFDVQGRPVTPKHDTGSADARQMSAGLLAAMNIPLVAGRPLTTHDGDMHAPPVAVVNRALGMRYFRGLNVVGQRLLLTRGSSPALISTEIVGVVGDVLGTGGTLSTNSAPEIYFPEDGGWPHMQFAVRSAGERTDMEQAARSIVSSLDPAATIGNVRRLHEVVSGAKQQPQLSAELLTLFAGFGLVLVIIGVYGLAAFQLAQRGREFAVRMALGSSREAIFRLMLRDALHVLLWGLPLGLACVLVSTRLLRAVTPYGTQTLPVWTLLATAMVLFACAVGATLQPARRAATLDPMNALRAE